MTSFLWNQSNSLNIAGGYPSSATSLSIKNRFLGWIDDIAFYNRVLSPDEVANNWWVQCSVVCSTVHSVAFRMV